MALQQITKSISQFLHLDDQGTSKASSKLAERVRQDIEKLAIEREEFKVVDLAKRVSSNKLGLRALQDYAKLSDIWNMNNMNFGWHTRRMALEKVRTELWDDAWAAISHNKAVLSAILKMH